MSHSNDIEKSLAPSQLHSPSRGGTGWGWGTTIEEAMERLFVLAKIEKGIKQADEGQCIPHDKAKENRF